LVATESFEAWAIAWPPGGSIELHDHGDSAGAVTVVQGELHETTVAVSAHGGVETRATALPPGASTAFSAGHIHDIANLGDVAAVSVHVYAPRLTTMTYYEIKGDRPAPGPTVRYLLGRAVP
jgi:predicted metal-dependent enzyme (double-stranded beta helix superfamily)